MERFGELLAKSIRDSDVYTRYSLNQYLVLMVSFGEIPEREAVERLCQDWKTFEDEEGLRVEMEIQALEAPSRKEVV